jgi:hypothetical protein
VIAERGVGEFVMSFVVMLDLSSVSAYGLKGTLKKLLPRPGLIFSSLDIVSKTADYLKIGLVLLPCQQQKSLRHLAKSISQDTL